MNVAFKRRLPLALIVFLAAAVRFFRLGHGLEDLRYVDAFKFVGQAARMAANGDFHPRIFQYPGLYSSVLAVVYRLFGFDSDVALHLAAQAVSALAGVGVVVVTYLLARRVCAQVPSLLAALVTALCPAAVTHSRLPTPDTGMVFFMILALWLLLEARPTWWHVIGAGAAVGAAIGCKFTALYILPFIPVILLTTQGTSRWRWVIARSGVVFSTALVTFTATTPFFWANFSTYAERLVREAQTQRFGQIGRIHGGFVDYLVSFTPTWETPWLGTSIWGNLGFPALFVLVAAVVAALAFRFGWKGFILAFYAVLFVALISGPGRLKAYRFLLPVLPVFYVVAACLVEDLQRRFRPRIQWVLSGVLAASILVIPALHTMIYLNLMVRPVTNALAAEWLRENVPPGTPVFISPFCTDNLLQEDIVPVLIPNAGSRMYRRPEGLGASAEREIMHPPGMVDHLRNAGVRFVVLNSYYDDGFRPVEENLRYFPRAVAAHAGFMGSLHTRGRLVHEVKGLEAGRLGPDIIIYELQ